MMHPLIQFARALRLIFSRPPLRFACAKKTKGPRAATRMSAPWRQGTETGSEFIVFRPISTINPQRQLGQQRKDH